MPLPFSSLIFGLSGSSSRQTVSSLMVGMVKGLSTGPVIGSKHLAIV